MNQGQMNNYKHGPHLEQLPVGDEAVVIDVVDPKGEPQLLLFVRLAAELGHPLHKLFEVDLTTVIIVENICNHNCVINTN